jgi:acyl-CoA synthetase (NDP forming)
MDAPRDIAAFFEPRSVAVIGASRTPGKAGYQQLVNLQRGFAGCVYPINPQADAILGFACFPSLSHVPGPVDLAIILVPAPRVPDAARECVEKGVPAILIASAGFSEIGAEGRRLQDACLAITRGTSTRLWGPNCNGLVNAHSRLLASFVDLPDIRQGSIAIVSQTGIFAAAFLNQLMEREGFGVSKVATLGNAADVNATDLLSYLADDPATEVIAVHLEGVRNGAKFLEACRKLASRKPVVALVAGQTEAGARASLSHTANLAADGRLIRGALRQAGIAEAGEFLELMDLAEGLATLRRPARAGRIAVMTTTGGAGVVATDLIAVAGCDLATLEPGTRDALIAYEPGIGSAINPLDIWPAMQRHGTNAAVTRMAELVLSDPGVDAAILITGAFSGGGQDFDPARLGPLLEKHRKPMVGWLYGPEAHLASWRSALRKLGVPVFRDLRTAVSLLRASDELARWRGTARMIGREPAFEGHAVSRLLEARQALGEASLSEPEGYELLRACGIASPAFQVTGDEDIAAEAARALGGHVVLKIVSRHITHKSEMGGVAVNLRGDDEVRSAFRRITEGVAALRPAPVTEGVLVQQYLAGGREVVVGVTTKPEFGRAVMVGLGGIWVELMSKVAFGIPPLSRADIDQMIGESGVELALQGQRGRPPADREKLVETLMALSSLAESELPIDQLEINPLLVFDKGKGVMAVDAVVTLAPSQRRGEGRNTGKRRHAGS